MKILLKIRFVGTNYAGYQVQNNAPTVQGELCRAAEQLFGGRCDVTGCSRTDSGVHANVFCAAVTEHGKQSLETTVPTDKIPRAMNAFLPPDIAVISAEEVEDSFHPRYDVKSKEYVYFIQNGGERNPFMADRCLFYPKRLDVERMNEAAQMFVGEHDFATYMAAGSKVESTVRTVYSASVVRDGDVVKFAVRGNGFLYNMVRIMTGTLLAVGEDKIPPEEIPQITESLDRKRAGSTAPAC
ncbi:MAG: tRNA pseudouridine(38-40) synthase TruA [Clostridia bacterium]|nr:tRNA pseudouridine(38-40) synthase TruA [Clostridia bacterium]